MGAAIAGRDRLDAERELVTTMIDDDLSAEELERRRRAKILDDARANVERLADLEKRREEISTLEPRELSRRLIPAAPDDAVARWAAEADAVAAEREAAKAELASSVRRRVLPFVRRSEPDRLDRN